MNQRVDTRLRGDFHVHSQFSDDATSTMAENLAAAAAVGLTQIRLIDHVRQSTTWVPEYLAAIAALKPVDGLSILTGVEAKILNAAGDLDIPSDLVVGAGGVDAIVIADHQFPGPDGAWTPEQTKARIAHGLAESDALDLLVEGFLQAFATDSEGFAVEEDDHILSNDDIFQSPPDEELTADDEPDEILTLPQDEIAERELASLAEAGTGVGGTP